MRRFIEEADRTQLTLLPESLDDYIGESNPVRAIEAFVAHLDLSDLGFEVVPEVTGRPGYHPSVLLRLYIYGYLNRISSSRCLEREAGRNLGGDLAARSACARRQGHRRLPQRQRSGHQTSVREVRRAVPADGAADEGERRHRLHQVQGREQPRQEITRKISTGALATGRLVLR